MAIEGARSSWSLVASSDFSSSQYFLGKLDTNGQFALAGVGVNAQGVMQDKPVIGRVGSVTFMGVSKVVAGAAVGAGVDVMSDATGRIVAATTGNYIIGTTLYAASGVGIITSILLRPGGKA